MQVPISSSPRAAFAFTSASQKVRNFSGEPVARYAWSAACSARAAGEVAVS